MSECLSVFFEWFVATHNRRVFFETMAFVLTFRILLEAVLWLWRKSRSGSEAR